MIKERLIKSISVIKEKTDLYTPDDIPAFVEKEMKKFEIKPESPRTDLVKGQIVVVLEGVFASKRVVYLKHLEGEEATDVLCAGPASVNGVPFFKINQRYLLATSTVLDIKADASIDTNNVFKSMIDEYDEPADIEMTEEEKKLNTKIEEAIKAVKYMKAYLADPFSIDTNKSFYSMKY